MRKSIGISESERASLVTGLHPTRLGTGSDAVSAVREMRRFGLEPTYALPLQEGASD